MLSLRAIRENLLLKIISLCAAIMLYFYVQGKRNPSMNVMLEAQVIVQDLPSGVEAVPSSDHILVQITGPELLVESLKDGDIVAQVNYNGHPDAKGGSSEILPILYTVPSLRSNGENQVHITGPATLNVSLHRLVTKLFSVGIPDSDPTNSSYYSGTSIIPSQVKCSGRANSVQHVVRVIVSGLPSQPGQIDDNFPVQAMDADGDIVPHVTLSPTEVHIRTLIVKETPANIVMVVPNIQNLPLPPDSIGSISVYPLQLQVVTSAGTAFHETAVQTAPINLSGVTSDFDESVELAHIPGVKFMTLEGRTLHSVRVHIRIIHAVSEQAPPIQTTAPASRPPKEKTPTVNTGAK